jgi:hypothetical protein
MALSPNSRERGNRAVWLDNAYPLFRTPATSTFPVSESHISRNGRLIVGSGPARHRSRRNQNEHVDNRLENNITAYPNATDASECAPRLAQFDSAAALAKLSADWPISRFVEIWNRIP